MADDVLPNDGEQKVDQMPALNEVEVDETKTSKKSIQEDMVDWFDVNIGSYGSIDEIQIDVMKHNGVSYDRKTSVEAQLLAHKLFVQLLIEKKAEFTAFLEKLNE